MRGVKSVLAVTLIAYGMAAPAFAQSLSYNGYMTADSNMRSSRVIGMPVFNDRNEKIGVVDDILLPTAGGEVTAVLSVGGFIGVGQKLVKVPLSHVHFADGKPMMPDAGKPALMAMPAYGYYLAGGNG